MSATTPMIIAIDGPAASGKGSLARRLAEHLNYGFLDTGSLYRRVALAVLEQNIDPKDTNAVIEAAQNLIAVLDQPYDDSALRSDNVGQTASIVAQIQEVRDLLIQYQRDFPLQALQKGIKGAVLDGRDIGTVICPEAPIKLFITAEVEKRAQRRHKELQSRDIQATKPEVLAEMLERDARDQKRLDEHLAPPRVIGHDVHIIDTSDMTPDEVFNHALKIVTSH
ncbi:MAG: (d)CMP kinase [Alphaproteobacteria bacterium]|nr:(d)CMP kinase [Alphaproteobacteria bacterium]